MRIQQLQLNTVQLYDSILNVGQRQESKEFFTLEDSTTIQQGDPQRLTFTMIYMHNNIMEHSREVYGLLDLIGDVGGLSDGISYIVRGILFFLSFLGFDPIKEYLVEHMAE